MSAGQAAGRLPTGDAFGRPTRGVSRGGFVRAPVSPLRVSGVAVAAWLCLSQSCMALECPAPQPAGAPGAIVETPEQIGELSQILGSGDLGNRIPVYVRDLKARHPNVSAGEIVNYLVTAYCPVVNALNGLGAAEQQSRMDAFASQVAQAAY